MAKTMGVIPEKIINYKCYIDGEMSPTALVDAELPDIQFMSETISGAGIAGEIDSPTLGHFQNMEIGLNFRTLINQNFHNFTQKFMLWSLGLLLNQLMLLEEKFKQES